MVACLKVGNLAHSFVYQQIFHELPLCAVAVLARKCSLHLYLQLLIPEAPVCRKCQSGHDFTMNQKKNTCANFLGSSSQREFLLPLNFDSKISAAF